MRVRILFTAAIFLGSALLFLVQPMIAKMILPRFGGTPGVWNSSMVFFQASLLVGYGYAHLATKWLGVRRQSLAHVVILLLALLALPISIPAAMIWQEGTGGSLEVILVLAVAVGIPFTFLSAGAPLLQRWYGTTSDPHAQDPYFLYSASNLGSMVALLSYPFLIEPRFTLQDQTRLWSYGFYALVLLVGLCAFAIVRQKGSVVAADESVQTGSEGVDPERSAGKLARLRWVALSFVPSSLLLGVTTYITSNVAPVPLLWVIPLALYLLSFIIGFARRTVISTSLIARILPILITPLALILVLESSQFMVPITIFHLFVFFLVAWMCHGELAKNRPGKEHLTEFYFYLSLGGVLGGIFNAMLAPALFNSLFEYPLMLAAACMLRPPREGSGGLKRWDYLYPVAVLAVAFGIMLWARANMSPTQQRTGIAIGVPLILAFFATDRPIRYGLALLAVFVASGVTQIAAFGRIISAHRSFYGLHRVESANTSLGLFHSLTHGNTLHGRQNMTKDPGTPLTYYHPSGPIGQVFANLGERFRHVGLVGLGVGSLSAYGRQGQLFTFYELDPDVAKIARDTNLFTFVSNSKARIEVELGDARLTLARAAPESLDLIVLDAFSSDSIPIHLLTREAFQMYLKKLAPKGLLAVHVSNRYLELKPIVSRVAASVGLVARYREDYEATDEGKTASKWILLGKSTDDMGALATDTEWEALPAAPDAPLWTDDYSNLLAAFKSFD